MILAALGVVIGSATAALASGALAGLVFGISRHDPVTYVTVVLMLATATGVACWLPAARASRVDPVRTLKEE